LEEVEGVAAVEEVTEEAASVGAAAVGEDVIGA